MPREAMVPGSAEGRTLDERNRSIFDTIHALQDVLDAMKKRKGPLTGEQVRGEIAALQGNRSTGLHKASLDQVFAKERNKFLEKNGVGEDAIDKWYEKAGVSDEVFNKMYKDALREAGL